MGRESDFAAACGDRSANWQRHGDAALRFLAAVPLGYAVASAWAMALARLLPGDSAEATLAATLVALVLCAAAVMYAYAARSGVRAFATLLTLGGFAAVVTWASIQSGGRL